MCKVRRDETLRNLVTAAAAGKSGAEILDLLDKLKQKERDIRDRNYALNLANKKGVCSLKVKFNLKFKSRKSRIYPSEKTRPNKIYNYFLDLKNQNGNVYTYTSNKIPSLPIIKYIVHLLSIKAINLIVRIKMNFIQAFRAIISHAVEVS